MLLINILFIVAVLRSIVCYGNTSLRFSRAACKPSARIACNCISCKYRQNFNKYKFVAVFENCGLQEINIRWRIRYYKKELEAEFYKEDKLSQFDDQPLYTMEPFTVSISYFAYLYLDVTAKIGGASANDKTEIWMFPKRYYVELTLGARVRIHPESIFTVAVAKPVEGLRTSWKSFCEFKGYQYCTEWTSDHNFQNGSCPVEQFNVIMETYAESKTLIDIHVCYLRIKYFHRPDTYLPMPEGVFVVTVTPTVKPDKVVTLMCVRNCGYDFDRNPADPKRDSVLEVKCFKNCESFDSSGKFRVSENKTKNIITNWKHEGTRLTIYKNASPINTTLYITYSTGRLLLASVYISTSRGYLVLQCEVEPSKGRPVLTDFEVKCLHKETNRTHYVQRKYHLNQLSGSKSQIKLLAISLIPSMRTSIYADIASVKLEVGGIDSIGMPLSSEQFTVELVLEPVTKKILEEALKKMDYLNDIGDHAYVLNVGSALASALNTSKLSENERNSAKVGILSRMLRSLGKVEVDDMRVVEPVLESFYPVDDSFKDNLLKLCEGMTKKLSSGIGVAGSAKDQRSSSEALMKCGSEIAAHESKAAMDKLNQTKSMEDQTEPNTVPPKHSHVQESYPDYDTENGRELSNTEVKGINVMTEAAVIGGNSVKVGKEMRNETDNLSYLIKRDKAPNMAGKTFTVSDVSVTVGPAIAKLGNEVVILTFLRFPPCVANDSTPMIEVRIHKNRNLVDTVKGLTFILKLPLKKQFTENASHFNCSVPKSLAELHYEMNCHRVKVGTSSVLIRFHKIEKGVKLQVMFTSNRRPEYNEFDKEGYVLDGDIQNVYSYSFDSSVIHKFLYACVLPYKGKSKHIFGVDSNDGYDISIVTASCNSLSSANMWEESGCKSTIELGKTPWIECKCSHTTLFAGIAKATTSSLNKQERREFTLEYFVNWIVFSHVVAVFFVYCLLLLLIKCRKPSTFKIDKIIFLSDNRKNDRYAYLIVVETGSAIFSGTTSNVGIKLFGKYAKSDPHILNYPDPDKKLLQRQGLDWMVLTTMKYLGPLKYIHLWFDSIGCRPQWRCESVTILDLQSEREYYFNVCTWLTLSTKQGVCERYVNLSTKHKANKDVITQLRKHMRLYIGPEHTWNFLNSNEDYDLTYSQRLTIILSLIFTVYFLCLIMLSHPMLRLTDEIGYGRFKFEAQFLYIPTVAALVAALTHFPAVYFFRNSSHSLDKNSLFKVKKIYGNKVSVVVWIILLTWVFLITSYLIIFGFWIAIYTSIYWMMSTTAAILLLVFVLENIYIALYNTLKALYGKAQKTMYYFKRIINEIEHQRKFVYKYFGENLLRPYFKLHYKVLGGVEYKITQIREIMRFEARVQMFDLIIFCSYIIVMYYLSLCHAVDLGYFATHRVLDKFSICRYAKDSNTYCEDRLYTIKSVYDYINYTVLPRVFPDNWYEGYHIDNPGMGADFSNKLLGVIQLRQQRTEQICTPPRYIKNYGWHCSNESKVFEDWPRKSLSLTSFTLGRLTYYGGSGYVADMGRTLINSRHNLRRLQNLNWIDINTKVLFIDFWTYNANYNFFNMIKLIIERSKTGRYVTRTSVYTSRFVFTGFAYYLNYIMITLLLIFVFVITYRCIRRWIKIKKGFLLVFWNIFDLTLAVMNVLFLYLYFHRLVLVDSLMFELALSDHNEFVDFSTLQFVARAGVIISAIILAMATLRLWSYLHFGISVFKVAKRALRRSFKDLFYISLQHAIIFVSFGLLFYCTYGSAYSVFSNFPEAVTTILVISMNKMDEQALDYWDLRLQGVWPYCILGLFLIVCVIVITLYSTIIMTAWTESKRYYSNKPEDYSIKDYLFHETMFLFEKIKRHVANLRLRGGEELILEDNDFVTPKATAVRYANVHHLSKEKLRYMNLIAQAVISKNINIQRGRNASTKDFALMAKLAVCMCKLKKPVGKEEQISFFCTKDMKTHDPVLVENYRLLHMEIIVKQMLSQNELLIQNYTFKSDNTAHRLLHLKNQINNIFDIVKCIQYSEA